jgi:hypothetical protein
MKTLIILLLLGAGFMFWKASHISSSHRNTELEEIQKQVDNETSPTPAPISHRAVPPIHSFAPAHTATAADYARINAENIEKERIAREQAEERAREDQNRQYAPPQPEMLPANPEVINQMQQNPQDGMIQPETQLPQYNPNTGAYIPPSNNQQNLMDPNANLTQEQRDALQMQIYEQQNPAHADPTYQNGQNPDAQVNPNMNQQITQ